MAQAHNLPRVIAEADIEGHEVRNAAGRLVTSAPTGSLRVEFTHGQGEDALRTLDAMTARVREQIVSTLSYVEVVE